MAIAGTAAIPACLISLVDGQLQAGYIHYYGAEFVEHDIDKAVERLRAGEVFRLRTTTDQLIRVRRMLRLRPPEDKRSVTIRKLRECVERNAGATWAGSVKVKLLQDALTLLE